MTPPSTAARGALLLVGLVAVVFVGSRRFALTSARGERAIHDAEVAFCDAIVGAESAVYRAARDAARLRVSDPYALFLLQLAGHLDDRDSLALSDAEGDALAWAMDGELARAQEALVDLAATGTLSDGRRDLWMQWIGAMDTLRRRDCQPDR